MVSVAELSRHPDDPQRPPQLKEIGHSLRSLDAFHAQAKLERPLNGPVMLPRTGPVLHRVSIISDVLS